LPSLVLTWSWLIHRDLFSKMQLDEANRIMDQESTPCP
jgi:hypothetical protein